MHWRSWASFTRLGLAAGLLLAGCRPLLQQDTEPEEPAEVSAPAALPTLGPTAPEAGAAVPTPQKLTVVPLPPAAPAPPGPPPFALPPMPGPGFPPAMGMPPFPPGGPGPLPLPAPGTPGLAPNLDPSARPSVPDLAYGAEPQQTLDLYLPENPNGPAPVVVFVHGGAWASGDKSEYAWLGAQLSRQGLLVAVINYRLSPAVQHPTHAYDVAAAVAWVYRQAETYGGDPLRLYLAGHSAGAHLAALVALDPAYLSAAGVPATMVQGVAAFAGAGYDLDARYVGTPLAPLFAPAFGSDPARWSDAAPLRYVKAGAPPFLIVHGLMDNQAPAASAQAFATALQREAVPITLLVAPNLDHFTALIAGVAAVPQFVRVPPVAPPDLGQPRGPGSAPGSARLRETSSRPLQPPAS